MYFQGVPGPSEAYSGDCGLSTPALQYVVHLLLDASTFITVVQNKEALPIDCLSLCLCLVLNFLCDLNYIT